MGALDAEAITSLIDSGVTLATSTATIVSAATANKRAARAAQIEAAAAATEAKRQQVLYAAQARAAQAETARLQAQGALSPWKNPWVIALAATSVGLVGIMVYRSTSGSQRAA
jgi:hypothetical protein